MSAIQYIDELITSFDQNTKNQPDLACHSIEITDTISPVDLSIYESLQESRESIGKCDNYEAIDLSMFEQIENKQHHAFMDPLKDIEHELSANSLISHANTEISIASTQFQISNEYFMLKCKRNGY